VANWREVVEGLDQEHRRMLEPGGLSGLFLRYPLSLANPAFVGGFYGLLISIPLLLLAVFIGEMEEWPFVAARLVAVTASLGIASMSISMAVKRPPVSLDLKRRYLFPFPFIGLLIMVFSGFYEFSGMVEFAGLALLVLPGPIYVQVSYAPRWRILRLIEREMDPFGGMKIPQLPEDEVVLEGTDSEMDEAVGEIGS
tara:strand:+ start:292 stop:882 length:591 start_codon:yes stop_codon:yes gene_type:complete